MMIDIWLDVIQAQPLIDRVALLCLVIMAAAVIVIVVALLDSAILTLRSRGR